MYKGIFYNNNKWRHGIFSYESVADVIAFAGHNMFYAVKFTDDDFAPLMKLKMNSEEPTSYMNPPNKHISQVDPMWEVTSKYYIDRMWQEYHKMKEELADTKCKLGQSEDYISEVLKPELADTKLKLKMAQSAWEELDKCHAERAKLHDELIIAEGQRDQARMRAAMLKTEEAFAHSVSEKAFKEMTELRAERDALLKVYESAEDFIGAQGTQYESDQYLMLCGVVGAYNQQLGVRESL